MSASHILLICTERWLSFRYSTCLLLYSMECKREEWGEAALLCSFWVWHFTVGVFFKTFYLFMFLGRTESSCYAQPFSSCGEPRLLPNCGARASHCGGISGCRAWTLEDGGFSSCGLQALELGIKSCGTTGLDCSYIYSPGPSSQTWKSCMIRQILNTEFQALSSW